MSSKSAKGLPERANGLFKVSSESVNELLSQCMILEVATFLIKPGQEDGFERAIAAAYSIISSADGYLSHKLNRCIEQPNKYLFFVWWETVEAHMVGFRKSEKYGQWRACLQEYYASPPVAEHFNLIELSH